MTWLLLCKSTETLPSVKMAPGFSPPQSESTDAEELPANFMLCLMPPHSADHNMHMLNSIHQLWTPAQGCVSFSWLGRSLALISSKCLSNISHHFSKDNTSRQSLSFPDCVIFSLDLRLKCWISCSVTNDGHNDKNTLQLTVSDDPLAGRGCKLDSVGHLLWKHDGTECLLAFTLHSMWKYPQGKTVFESSEKT